MQVRVVLQCKDGGLLREYFKMPFVPFPKLNISLVEDLLLTVTVDHVTYNAEDGSISIIVEKKVDDEIAEKLIKLGWKKY